MSEESVSTPSIWASMNSWFTPFVLFSFLNVMIGTIFFTSRLANQKQPQHQQEAEDDPRQPRLGRSPSVLQRLRSINLYSYRSEEPNPSPPITTLFKTAPDSDTHYPPEQTNPQVFEQTHEEQAPEAETQYVPEQTYEEDEEVADLQTIDEVYSRFAERHVCRPKSDTKPASGEVPIRLPQNMRKSTSLKLTFKHFEEEDIVEVRRPATVRESKAKVTDGDDEVDAKADDFINRFKQQLKLQRLDSIIRYKDVITRGSGK